MCSFRFRSTLKCDPREKDNLRYTILLLHAADGTKLPVACEEKPLREKKPVRKNLWYPELAAARLAQWDKHRSAEWEALGSNPGHTNTQGL